MVKHFQKIGWVILLLVVGCSGTDDIKPQNDFAYLPLMKGIFQVYDVEAEIFTLGVSQSNVFELKTQVVDSFLNVQGNYTYVMHRSRRETSGDAWQPLDTWSIRVANNEIIVSEQSTPYVVLRIPATQGLKWDGNKYNSLINPNTNKNEDLYTIIEKGISVEYNTNVFPDCVVIEQEDNQEFIVYNDKRLETYARDVGLVYKEVTNLKYCTDQVRNCIGQQIVDEGIIYKQRIKDYGRE